MVKGADMRIPRNGVDIVKAEAVAKGPRVQGAAKEE